MLDQTGYEPDTKTDPFTLEGLRDWLAGEIAAGRGARTYDYSKVNTCLLTRWHKAFGKKRTGPYSYETGVTTEGAMGWAYDVANYTPYTYTGAHDRTVALIKERSHAV